MKQELCSNLCVFDPETDQEIGCRDCWVMKMRWIHPVIHALSGKEPCEVFGEYDNTYVIRERGVVFTVPKSGIRF